VLGVDVQPSADTINAEYIPGLPVTAHSIPYDSIACFNDKYKFIGSNDDPYFGRTDIGLYLNTSIGVSNLDFGLNSRISSAEIILAIENLEYAGDKNAVLNFSVFPMTDLLSPSKIYYTNDTRHHTTSPICTYSTGFTEENGHTVIHIKIDSTYAETLLHDTPNLASNEVFQAKYKGYYIAANLQGASEGIIFKANLDDALSGFYLHYKTVATADSIIDFRFPFSGSTATRYNTVKFTPKQNLKDQFLDSTLGASGLYLKGLGMAALKLQIPFLKNHTDSFKVAVNRAELVLYVDPSFPAGSGNYSPPPRLILLSIDSLSRETYLKDLLSTTDNPRYDGNYDATNKRYVFNLAREAQLIFEGAKKNRGFYLVVANTDLSLLSIYAGSSKQLLPVRRDNYFQRVILAGTGSFQFKPSFNLHYIRFKND